MNNASETNRIHCWLFPPLYSVTPTGCNKLKFAQSADKRRHLLLRKYSAVNLKEIWDQLLHWMTVVFADVDVYFWHACFIREVLIKQIYLHFMILFYCGIRHKVLHCALLYNILKNKCMLSGCVSSYIFAHLFGNQICSPLSTFMSMSIFSEHCFFGGANWRQVNIIFIF